MTGVVQLAIPLALFFFMKYVDFTNTTHCLYIRIAYTTSLTLCGVILLFIKWKISLMKVDPKKKVQIDQYGVLVSVNYQEHDNAELKKISLETIFLSALIGFALNKYGYVQPLLFQAVVNLSNVLCSKLSQIHIYGASDIGSLARPWKVSNPIANLISSLKCNSPSCESEETNEPKIVDITEETTKVPSKQKEE